MSEQCLKYATIALICLPFNPYLQHNRTLHTSTNRRYTSQYTQLVYFQGYSCVDLLNAGMKDSGVYYLQIRGTTYWFLKVYCEQEVAEGGWTVST